MNLSKQLYHGKVEKVGEVFKVSCFSTTWQVKAVALLIGQAMRAEILLQYLFTGLLDINVFN
jgi:hypothetical protein